MASKNQALILLLSLLTLSSIMIKSSQAVDFTTSITGGKIAVYWGQNCNIDEGTLTETCDSNLYDIVVLAYFHVPADHLDLGAHCPANDCTGLAPQIRYCQSKGIKVLLSVEVDSVTNPDSLAKYLYDNFLSGNSGPLGAVALDGIDLAHIEYTSSEPWAELVKAINASTTTRKIYISGAPLCSTTSLDSAIETGLFDYLWVLYYGECSMPCIYSGDGNFTNLLESWAQWTSKTGLANTSVFLGLVASNNTAAAPCGYIPPELLKSQVLPNVTQSSNFGGVMLWDRCYDKQTGYSAEIINDPLDTKVCDFVRHVSGSRRFNSLLAKSA